MRAGGDDIESDSVGRLLFWLNLAGWTAFFVAVWFGWAP